jgi:hypothetical protein
MLSTLPTVKKTNKKTMDGWRKVFLLQRYYKMGRITSKLIRGVEVGNIKRSCTL